MLNGGIIATLIDCHSICTVVARAYRDEGRPFDSEPLIWFVTGSIKVDYLRPAPIDRTVELRARIASEEGKKVVVQCELSSDGTVCARGEVLAIRVDPAWRQGSGAGG